MITLLQKTTLNILENAKKSVSFTRSANKDSLHGTQITYFACHKTNEKLIELHEHGLFIEQEGKRRLSSGKISLIEKKPIFAISGDFDYENSSIRGVIDIYIYQEGTKYPFPIVAEFKTALFYIEYNAVGLPVNFSIPLQQQVSVTDSYLLSDDTRVIKRHRNMISFSPNQVFQAEQHRYDYVDELNPVTLEGITTYQGNFKGISSATWDFVFQEGIKRIQRMDNSDEEYVYTGKFNNDGSLTEDANNVIEIYHKGLLIIKKVGVIRADKTIAIGKCFLYTHDERGVFEQVSEGVFNHLEEAQLKNIEYSRSSWIPNEIDLIINNNTPDREGNVYRIFLNSEMQICKINAYLFDLDAKEWSHFTPDLQDKRSLWSITCDTCGNWSEAVCSFYNSNVMPHKNRLTAIVEKIEEILLKVEWVSPYSQNVKEETKANDKSYIDPEDIWKLYTSMNEGSLENCINNATVSVNLEEKNGNLLGCVIKRFVYEGHLLTLKEVGNFNRTQSMPHETVKPYTLLGGSISIDINEQIFVSFLGNYCPIKQEFSGCISAYSYKNAKFFPTMTSFYSSAFPASKNSANQLLTSGLMLPQSGIYRTETFFILPDESRVLKEEREGNIDICTGISGIGRSRYITYKSNTLPLQEQSSIVLEGNFVENELHVGKKTVVSVSGNQRKRVVYQGDFSVPTAIIDAEYFKDDVRVRTDKGIFLHDVLIDGKKWIKNCEMLGQKNMEVILSGTFSESGRINKIGATELYRSEQYPGWVKVILPKKEYDQSNTAYYVRLKKNTVVSVKAILNCKKEIFDITENAYWELKREQNGNPSPSKHYPLYQTVEKILIAEGWAVIGTPVTPKKIHSENPQALLIEEENQKKLRLVQKEETLAREKLIPLMEQRFKELKAPYKEGRNVILRKMKEIEQSLHDHKKEFFQAASQINKQRKKVWDSFFSKAKTQLFFNQVTVLEHETRCTLLGEERRSREPIYTTFMSLLIPIMLFKHLQNATIESFSIKVLWFREIILENAAMEFEKLCELEQEELFTPKVRDNRNPLKIQNSPEHFLSSLTLDTIDETNDAFDDGVQAELLKELFSLLTGSSFSESPLHLSSDSEIKVAEQCHSNKVALH